MTAVERLSTTTTREEIPTHAFESFEFEPAVPTRSALSRTASIPPQNVSEEYPDGGLRAWIVVAGAFCLLMSTFGVMNSVGLLQTYWQEHQLSNYSTSTIGFISSIFVFLNLALGLQVGPLFDRYGPRWIVAVGSVGYALSLLLLGSCTQYWHFILDLSILGGVSSAMISNPSLAVLAHWFSRRRGTAVGTALIGSSVGGALFPVILQSVLTRFGWGWAMRTLGFMVLAFLIVGNLCVRGRLPVGAQKGIIDFKCFGDSRFLCTAMGVFCSELVLFGALGLIPSYAVSEGFPTRTGSYLISVLNAGSAFGRWIPGMISDRAGPFNTMSGMFLFTLVFVLILWLPLGHIEAAMYTMAVLFGFGTGSFISLAPVCVGQLCAVEEFGKWYGTCYCVGSLASLVTIPIGGQLLQTAGPNALVALVGSFLAAGFGAFLMARWASLGWHWKWQIKV